ncbi:hypothetical protein [Nocardiopsis dassonvillei]|uniref:hypothetical protein n=1 Tax=Nocardiopsis dassonvillei TaxID=2014 RepID=UPI003F5701D5
MAEMEELLGAVAASDDRVVALSTAFEQALSGFVEKLQGFDAVGLVEATRLALLPIAFDNQVPVAAEAGAAQVELLALIALAAQREATATTDTDADAAPVDAQEMNQFVSEAKEELEKLLHLALLRSVLTVDPEDKYAVVSLLIRSSEILVRNPSYPEMVEVTNRALLDGEPNVRAALTTELGFDAADAVVVLNACHHLQEVGMNDRMNVMRETMMEAMASSDGGEPDAQLVERAWTGFTSVFTPNADQATVTIEDIAAETGIIEARVEAVVERFRLHLGAATPAEVVEAFITGKNPMRTRPLIVTGNGRMMLPHPALSMAAVRENLEEHLKGSPAIWDIYQKYRGDLLESRVRTALGRVLPGAQYRDGFEYYVPANDTELATADPTKYTKRVEGDHLVLLDDVALVVEDKAVALSAHSRGGRTPRVRSDLTKIITKAAEQAGRVREGIERDGGLRIEGEGWVDLSHIREIHTIAVSLDDLSTVLTATRELVKAGLLDLDNIPWTVSLHDLELISELISRPAEFLLYLRRRRNPDVTVMFKAADELDLFLYFFEAGLHVEPDPARVHAAFPITPEPTTAQLRRYRAQQPAFLTSRTDALDQWFHTRHLDAEDSARAPKPAMVPSPVGALLDELQERQDTGWLSISATMLSMDTMVQKKFARHANDLLDNPSPDGTGRSLTMTITGSVDPAEGWLFVWATRPAGKDSARAELHLRGYLRTKKHQLGIPRGVVFLYDEPTRQLAGVYYDAHIGPLDAVHTAALRYLRPVSGLQRRIHPNVMRPPRSTRRISHRR